MPIAKREAYEALYEQRPNMTRIEFFNLRQNWAQEQGAKIKKEFRKYRRNEERYIVQRDRVLKDRLDRMNGSNEAKNFIYELLDLQSNMSVIFQMYETKEEEMRYLLSPALLLEATRIWNSLDPAHIN